MLQLSAGKIIIKKSKFYAHLYKITSASQIDEIIKKHKNNYSNANHHCWAIIYKEKNKYVKQFQNDGEVGYPGKILLQILERNNLCSHALVVSRVFGGIKLGIGGVSRAFRKAGNGAIKLAKEK